MALFVSGCAGLIGTPDTPEQAVKARAQERWNAMVAKQFDKAYEYITPSGRVTLSKQLHSARLSGANWLSAKVTSAVCEPEVCDVTVTLGIEVMPNLPHQQAISEKWILSGGKWWFVYRG